MIEYLKKSIWIKMSVFLVIASVILSILSSLTKIGITTTLSTFFIVGSSISISVTVYLLLNKLHNFNRLFSVIIFFIILSLLLKLCNVILGNNYLDAAWRYSLVIGGIAVILNIFFVIFGKRR